MIRQFTANIEDNESINNVVATGIDSSKHGETIYMMSNKKMVQLAHRDFREELEEEGYFVSLIFEYGNVITL